MSRPKKKGEKAAPDSPLTDAADFTDSGAKVSWKKIKHFTPKEFTCKCDGLCDHQDAISVEMVAKLDKIRDAINMPVKINSGTRCVRHNLRSGGKERSAHVPKNGPSHAADIHCPNSAFRCAFLREAVGVFPRIGVGKTFIHVDDDPELPQDVVWVY